MRIKQTLAAFLTLASVLSCAACGSQSSSSTRTSSTSSDSDSYAKWLDDRLGDNVGKVTIGVGNDAKYGIDMSDFEDDGYIIRNIGTETLIFGKTDSGLDRAVRKYAKNVEAGTAIENVTFHEGTRIEKLTLFGTFAFKTDNDDLFEFSLESVKASPLSLGYVTYDLHASDKNENNVMTEYERNFSEQGIPIKYLEAIKE